MSDVYSTLVDLERIAVLGLVKCVASGQCKEEQFNLIARVFMLISTTRKLLLCDYDTINKYYDPERGAIYIPEYQYIYTSRKCDDIERAIMSHIDQILARVKQITSNQKQNH